MTKAMLELTPQDIGDFQRIWLEETGQKIPPEKAKEYAENLVSLTSLILDPRPP